MTSNITTIVGVLTLIVGVASFILTELDKRRRAIASLMRTWQSDTVAYIIDESGSDGLVFDEIKAKYLSAAHQKRSRHVASYMLQDDEIRRALFELQSRGVVHRMENDRYVCSRREDSDKLRSDMDESMNNVVQKMMGQMTSVIESVQKQESEQRAILVDGMTSRFEKFFEFMQEIRREQTVFEQSERTHREIQRAALEIAGRDPSRYTADQIAIEVMDRTKADRVVVMIQIISLLQNGILTQDGEGKVSIRLFRLPDSVISGARKGESQERLSCGGAEE